MRGFGMAMLGVGVVAAILLAFYPTELSVFGTDVSCGPPVLRVIAGADDDVLGVGRECVRKSWVRLIAAIFAGGGLMLVGAIVAAAAATTTPGRIPPAGHLPTGGGVPPGWYRDPWDGSGWRWWDGAAWTSYTSNGTDWNAPR